MVRTHLSQHSGLGVKSTLDYLLDYFNIEHVFLFPKATNILQLSEKSSLRMILGAGEMNQSASEDGHRQARHELNPRYPTCWKEKGAGGGRKKEGGGEGQGTNHILQSHLPHVAPYFPLASYS